MPQLRVKQGRTNKRRASLGPREEERKDEIPGPITVPRHSKDPTWEIKYHVYSAVSAVKSDLTSFRPPPISMNFFYVENLWGFRRPQVSLLNPLILLYDRHILP